jgi:hypothetical protein
MVAHTCNPSYAGGGGRRIVVSGWPGQKWETLSGKQTKKDWGVAQVVKHLSCKCKALSSIPKQNQRNWKIWFWKQLGISDAGKMSLFRAYEWRYIHYTFFLRQGLAMQPLTGDPAASASQVLGLQVYATTCSLHFWMYMYVCYWHVHDYIIRSYNHFPALNRNVYLWILPCSFFHK